MVEMGKQLLGWGQLEPLILGLVVAAEEFI
jgi:hypothetical protein